MRRFRPPNRINRGASQHVRPLSTALYYTAPFHNSSPTRQLQPRSYIQPLPQLYRHASSSSTPTDIPTSSLQKTRLYDLHIAHGAKMVPFGGFHMPVSYASQSLSVSHHFTRSHASLFDVSHMVQHRLAKPGARQFLEKITPAALDTMEAYKSTLSTLLWPTGGIVDDLMISRLGPEDWYLVTNAGCREKDQKFIREELDEFLGDTEKEVHWKVLEDWGLIALQGPLSVSILKEVVFEPEKAGLDTLYFGESRYLKFKHLDGKVTSELLITRGGYTGEDGFEISIPPEETLDVTETLLKTAGPERLQLAGLGARDSLRLEAGMCLYGHDLNDNTTPVEAALGWLIPKERRQEQPGFNGADIILPQLTPKSKGGKGVDRRRVGLIVDGAPAREGAEIVNQEGERIGHVTSGCPSPTLGKNIAMGYVKDGYHKSDTEVGVLVRGKTRKAHVQKMPFVPAKYWKAPVKK